MAILAEEVLVAYCFPSENYDPDTDLVQARAFQDVYLDLIASGANVVGISSRSQAAVLEFSGENDLTYVVLSDESLAFARALGLPRFIADGETHLHRLAFVAIGGRVAKLFFPVPAIERNAAQIAVWLKAHVD